MIGALVNTQTGSPGAFADGLDAWRAGDDSEQAEAASRVVAEVLLLGRTWLKAQMKK